MKKQGSALLTEQQLNELYNKWCAGAEMKALAQEYFVGPKYVSKQIKRRIIQQDHALLKELHGDLNE